MIKIFADNSNHNLGVRLTRVAKDLDIAFVLITLEDKRILPCTGCSSCSSISFRRCVLKDDMEEIYRALTTGGPILMLTPLVFGGYSGLAKTVQERFSAFGDPRYYAKDGELIKGMGVKNMKYYAIGVKDKVTRRERDLFLTFHHENLRIMNVSGKAWILSTNASDDALCLVLQEIADD